MRTLLLFWPLMTGCLSIELTQSWQLDRLRVLAVQAEPAEPQPGDVVTFSSLLYVPPELSLEGVVWFACLPEDATDFGCTLDVDVTDIDTDNPEDIDVDALIEAGFIGFQPFLQPTWVAPADALDGLDERQTQEGVSALINVSAVPVDAESEDDLELSYKRVPISLSPTPNNNPVISEVQIDGTTLAADEVFLTSVGRTHTLDAILREDTLEDYRFTTSEGVEEERVEEPYFTWYVEAGDVDQAFSLYPFSDIEWTAPNEAFEGIIAVVVRDRRGGMGWASFRVQVEP